MANREGESQTQSESLSIDTTPMSPRPSMELEENEVESNQEVPNAVDRHPVNISATVSLVHLPSPPVDWKLNVFLKKISDNLSEDDLNDMKSLLRGVVGKRVLEKIQSPLECFRTLQDRGMISRENLLILQTVLLHVGRKDLVMEAVKYSNRYGNVLHFYEPSEFPENGYMYVNYHIEGKDFTTYSREDLETLRTTVGDWLCVPTQFIFVRVIQPSSSLIITLMIPEMYVGILLELLKANAVPIELRKLGVDIIAIEGEMSYNIEDTADVKKVTTEQHNKLVVIYEQLEQANTQLETVEVANLDLQRRVDDLQAKLAAAERNFEKSKMEANILYGILSKFKNEFQETPATLKEQSSLAKFRESMKQICDEPIDKKVVDKMINATVNIVATRMKESNRILERKMLLDLEDMQSKIDPLMFQLDRFRFLSDPGTIDDAVTKIQTLFQKLLGYITKKISNQLRYKEKEKLKKKYQWNPDGEVEKMMNDDKDYLFSFKIDELEHRNHLLLIDSYKYQFKKFNEIGYVI